MNVLCATEFLFEIINLYFVSFASIKYQAVYMTDTLPVYVAFIKV